MLTQTTRMPKFGKTSRIYRTTDPLGLTDEQIRHVAPSAFAEDKHKSRSKRYTYTPTSEVLGGLRREGFLPMEVRQAGARDDEKRDHTKHMIRFRHASNSILRVGGAVHEIVLINSHDGTSSHQLLSGMFKMICSNGLIVSEGPHTSVRIPHTGNANELVIEGCIDILSAIPETSDKVQRFEGLRLTEDEQAVFARAALSLRYPVGEDEPTAPITPTHILETRRIADADNSLWSVFNRIQENLVMGGQHYTRNRRNNSTREVRAIDSNVRLNQALWLLADGMAELKAA